MVIWLPMFQGLMREIGIEVYMNIDEKIQTHSESSISLRAIG